MRALSVEELGFVSGGVFQDSDLYDIEERTFYDGFKDFAANCPPATVEAQQIGGMSGAVSNLGTVAKIPFLRLLPPYLQAAIYGAAAIGGAIGGVLTARALARAECWMREQKQGPYTS